MLLVGAACYTSFVLWGSTVFFAAVFLGALLVSWTIKVPPEDNSADEINAPEDDEQYVLF
jgi:hypothetical protein